MTKFLDAILVKEVLDNSKGRYISIIAVKKDGTDRKYNYNPQECEENAPSFKYHKNLVSIIEKGKGYKSFDVNKVKEIRFNGQVLKAV